MKNICIAFDLDGTLIDSREDIARSVNLLRKRFGLTPLPVEKVVTYIGNGVKKLVERAFADDPEDIAAAQTQVLDCYRETLVVKTTLYPGVAEGLRTLHEAGFRLAVATNKSHTLCAPLLDKLGILPYFDAVEGGDTGLPMKPDPAQILAVLKATGCAPEKSWVLGDNYTDLAAAQAAGCRKAFAAYGFGNPKEYSWDFKAETFSGFANHILQMQ